MSSTIALVLAVCLSVCSASVPATEAPVRAAATTHTAHAAHAGVHLVPLAEGNAAPMSAHACCLRGSEQGVKVAPVPPPPANIVGGPAPVSLADQGDSAPPASRLSAARIQAPPPPLRC